MGLTHDPARGRVSLAWQAANPELRMGSPSWSWITAFSDAVRAAEAVEPAMTQPVLVLQPGGGDACKRLAHCTLQPIGGAGQALELEADGARGPWLKALEAFIERNVADVSPSPTGARVPAGG